VGILHQFKGSNFKEKKQDNSINPKGNLLSKSSILKPRSPIKPEIITSPNKPISAPLETPEVDTLYVTEDYFNEGYA
jgi:hypothetical protein